MAVKDRSGTDRARRAASDPSPQLRLAQIATADLGGGAAKVGQRLQAQLVAAGHGCVRIVGHKRGNERTVLRVPNPVRHAGSREWFLYYLERATGLQYLSRPGTRDLLRWVMGLDLVHVHNVHGDYFELRRLAELCARVPTVLTLHDAFLATGHCAHPMDCPRWMKGCGHCPDLDRYPGVRRDATAFNRQWYRDLVARAAPSLIAPSHWIRNLWQQAGMAGDPAVIPPGVDLNRYVPGDRTAARRELGIPAGGPVVLFSAFRGTRNAYRDTSMLWASLHRIAARVPDVTFVLVGGDDEAVPGSLVRHTLCFPFIEDEARVIRLYQAADVLFHPSRADTAPLVVVEAQACGLPVVATAVGGIPELVDDGDTGHLVAAGDDEGAARQLELVLQARGGPGRMGDAARTRACARHDERRALAATLEVYQVAVQREGWTRSKG
ncbi:MAG: glycosyltransferase [Pseudomonadota bacterium]